MTTMSRLALINRAKDILEEGVSGYLDDAKWIELANQAHKFTVKDVNGLWTFSVIPSVKDLGVYALPDTVLNVMEVSYDGERLQYASSDDLSDIHPKWRTAVGTPRAYSLTGIGQSIVLYPAPNANGKEIKIHGPHVPVDFAGDNDTVVIPAPYDELVVNRLVVLAAKANMSDPTVFQKMALAEQEYVRMARDLRTRNVWPSERRAIKGTRTGSLPRSQRTVIVS